MKNVAKTGKYTPFEKRCLGYAGQNIEKHIQIYQRRVPVVHRSQPGCGTASEMCNMYEFIQTCIMNVLPNHRLGLSWTRAISILFYNKLS